jgi:hypothetical protein
MFKVRRKGKKYLITNWITTLRGFRFSREAKEFIKLWLNLNNATQDGVGKK